jgi:hypothetical protein
MLRALWILCLLLMVGCTSSEEPRIKKEHIYGNWKAESYDLDGLKIPLGAEIEVSAKKMLVIAGDSKQEFVLSDISLDAEDQVVVSIENGIGITFHMLSPKKMYFQIPIIGTKIIYDKL